MSTTENQQVYDKDLQRANKKAKVYKSLLDKERLAHKVTQNALKLLQEELNAIKSSKATSLKLLQEELDTIQLSKTVDEQPSLENIRAQKWECAPSITKRALRQYCQKRWDTPALKWCNSPETGLYDKDLKDQRMSIAKEELLKK